jgi:hypothetical protein
MREIMMDITREIIMIEMTREIITIDMPIEIMMTDMTREITIVIKTTVTTSNDPNITQVMKDQTGIVTTTMTKMVTTVQTLIPILTPDIAAVSHNNVAHNVALPKVQLHPIVTIQADNEKQITKAKNMTVTSTTHMLTSKLISFYMISLKR